jgi:division protein CdvB (Snf7/Vps24/ESCRT-III family)
MAQGEGEDEDADDLVNQVLDEIGITTSSQVGVAGF